MQEELLLVVIHTGYLCDGVYKHFGLVSYPLASRAWYCIRQNLLLDGIDAKHEHEGYGDEEDDVQTAPFEEYTALHFAAQDGHLQLTEALLACGMF